MFPQSALPRCVALLSKHDNSSHLRIDESNDGGNLVRLISGSVDDHGDHDGVNDPRSRFYLEPSKEHDGLVHVRCCYNNKYWVPQQQGTGWMIGTAHEPAEDLSKPACTLFKLVPVAGEDGSTRFLHSQLGKSAGVSLSSSDTSTMRPYLHIAHEEARQGINLIDAFTVTDVSKKLPAYVAFKGDNGRFLASGYRYYLHFTKEDVGDPSVLHHVTTRADGLVHIKNIHINRFWCSAGSSGWVWADETSTAAGRTIFRVLPGNDFVAIEATNRGMFCRRFTGSGRVDCLDASITSITNAARLQCHEPVISRQIYDVNFRMNDARTYTTDVDGITRQSHENRGSTTDKTKLTLRFTTITSSTWDATVSMKLGVETTFSSGVPFLVKGEIKVTAEFSGSYSWGNSKTTEEEVVREFEVEVPPMKKVTVMAIASNGVCDIPFSYKQQDRLINGQEVVEEFNDGLYRGIKTSSVDFLKEEEDL